MKFSIGDKIVLNRTGEEGHVTAYINNVMIEVEVSGINFPVHLDEIDHPYLKWFTDKTVKKKATAPPEQLPVEKEKFRKQRFASGIYLSFIPVFKLEEMEDIVDYLKVYLLNELPQNIMFKYDVRLLDKTDFNHEGKLHGFGHIYLHNIAYDDMNDQPRFHWALTDADNAGMAIADGVLKIKPAKLFEQVNELLKNSQPSFAYSLITEFLPAPKNTKPEKFDLPQPKPFFISSNATSNVQPPKYELDLHIENLVDNSRGLNNTEMLQIQLDTLKHYLQLAILHRQAHMYVIHGIGKGVLKEKVHKLLKQTSHVKSFENQYHAKYGYGATEVHFKY